MFAPERKEALRDKANCSGKKVCSLGGDQSFDQAEPCRWELRASVDLRGEGDAIYHEVPRLLASVVMVPGGVLELCGPVWLSWRVTQYPPSSLWLWLDQNFATVSSIGRWVWSDDHSKVFWSYAPSAKSFWTWTLITCMLIKYIHILLVSYGLRSVKHVWDIENFKGCDQNKIWIEILVFPSCALKVWETIRVLNKTDAGPIPGLWRWRCSLLLGRLCWSFCRVFYWTTQMSVHFHLTTWK